MFLRPVQYPIWRWSQRNLGRFPVPHCLASQMPFPISPWAKTYYFHFISYLFLYISKINFHSCWPTLFLDLTPGFSSTDPLPLLFPPLPWGECGVHVGVWVGFFVGWHFIVCFSACNIIGAALTQMRHWTLIRKVCSLEKKKKKPLSALFKKPNCADSRWNFQLSSSLQEKHIYSHKRITTVSFMFLSMTLYLQLSSMLEPLGGFFTPALCSV